MLYEFRTIGLYAGSDIMTSGNKRTKQSNYKSEEQRRIEPPLQSMLGKDIAKINRSFQDRPRINLPITQISPITS
jgi:predicted permease